MRPSSKLAYLYSATVRLAKHSSSLSYHAMESASGIEVYRCGDPVEVFYKMPFPEDHGRERVDILGDRWIQCATASLGSTRPRIGWTQRWLPAVVMEVLDGGEAVRVQWELRQWYDWATGEHIEISRDPHALEQEVDVHKVRKRTAAWRIPENRAWTSTLYPTRSEMAVGGCEVTVSFIVFQWGAAKIPLSYDAHSWGSLEGSTVSNRFIRLFFRDAVIPKFGYDYEVLTVFIQHSDEFAGISPEFLGSVCRGRRVCALYFLWPIQGTEVKFAEPTWPLALLQGKVVQTMGCDAFKQWLPNPARRSELWGKGAHSCCLCRC